VKSINCTGFLKKKTDFSGKKKLLTDFLKKKKTLFTLVNSGTVEGCCTVHSAVQQGAATRSR